MLGKLDSYTPGIKLKSVFTVDKKDWGQTPSLFGLFLFLVYNCLLSAFRIWRIKSVFYPPFFHVLPETLGFGFVFHERTLLRPFDQTAKIYFVSAADNDVTQGLFFNSSPDSQGINPEKTGGLGDGNAD